ncbi:MAG: 3-deoxy-7-phosphoheptulonate synthase [Thalassobium sp.]|nr:MAG: 3-deoxy-7-phosphoheptulonate synthase [Thalassobium sp.]
MNWLPNINGQTLIAGPCSAETEEQLVGTAKEIAKDNRVTMLRAGIWKPRTRPGNFEGIGVEGLEWLRSAKQETSLPTCIEVANPDHVFNALKYGVDLVWIGARTSANPFSVQEIAEALRGTDIDVLVKNPINPDLNLWAGAIERLDKVGIKNIGAIHRGFSKYQVVKYRNDPQWQIPIQLKQELPDLVMIGDPSHLGGRRSVLSELAQQALDLNYNGLMIESHLSPDKAWSDAKQQVTPSDLTKLIDRLVYREESGATAETKLKTLRESITDLDREVLELLCQRMEVARSIGQIKKENKMTILQSDRWKEVKNETTKLGVENGLSDSFLSDYLSAIHEESISQQTKVMNE